MNHQRKKSRELSASGFWPVTSKHSKHTRSLSREEPKRYKNTISFPIKQHTLKQHNPMSFTFFQPQTVHKSNERNDIQNVPINVEQPFFKSEKNPTKQYISQKITQIVENQILPFFTQKLNSLEKKFKRQTHYLHKQIESQNAQITQIKQQNQQLRYWLEKQKTFVEVGTSPIKSTQFDRIFTSQRNTNLQSLNHLNNLLQLLSGSLEEENCKRKEQMGQIQKRMKSVESESGDYTKKLTNITQTFNQNFIELDERVEKLEKKLQQMSFTKYEKKNNFYL